MQSVQIIDNDCIRDYAENKYPNLYTEVMKHDRVSNSSWYDLTEKAFEEYKIYFEEMKELGVFRTDSEIKAC